jgi:hypothetical protein
MTTKLIALGLLGIASVLIAHDYIELEGEKSWF